MINRNKVLILLLVLVFVYVLIVNTTSITSTFADSLSYGTVVDEANEDTKATSGNENPNVPSKGNLYIVGDVMLARDVERTMLAQGNDYPYRNISFDTEQSYVLANFESAIPIEHQPTPNNTFRFSVNSKFLPALRSAGFSHVSLANNHAFDHGLSGYNNSVTSLWDNDLIPFGHPTVLSTSSISFLTVDNVSIAIIALHTLLNQPEDIVLKQIVDFASQRSDLQIVYVHWGDEYSLIHSKSQENLAKKLSSYGVDIVVGHHPHVVQDVAKIGNTIVFYSLGNYIFDQYFSESVQNGLMLKLSFQTDNKIELLPITSIGSRNQPRYQTQDESKLFLNDIASRSDLGLTQQIMSGLIKFDITLASSSEVAIMAE